MNSIAVLFDVHLYGGRETYVAEILREIKTRMEIKCGLLARSVAERHVAEIFDHKMKFSETDFLFDTNTNLQNFFETLRPKLIWAQHCEFLQGLFLSNRYAVPLLPTFHTPFREGTVWNSPLMLLGVALVLNRCPLIAGVSDEILQSLVALGVDESKLRLLPNRIRIIENPTGAPNDQEVRVVLLTRSEKVGHIRAAISFFHALRRILPSARMSIYCAHTLNNSALGQNNVASKIGLARRVVGGRWLAKNLWFFRDLPAVDFYSPTNDARSVIRDANIVLGMGRVLLEGLSLGKISILVGYQRVVAIVSPENFRHLMSTNLSGRDVTPSPMQKIIEETVEKLRENYSTPPDILDQIDLSSHWTCYADLFAEVVKKSEFNHQAHLSSIDASSLRLAQVSTTLSDLRAIASSRELEIFRKLSNLGLAPTTIN